MSKEEQIRQECWVKSLHALGTSYIFSLKGNTFKNRIRFISVLGVVAPLLIGATAAAYGLNSSFTTLALSIAAPITVFQIVFSGISLVYKWDDQFAYSLESQSDNRNISEEFETLGKYGSTDIIALEKQFEKLKAIDNARTIQDEKIRFSEKENRKGMRYALWVRQKECATCKMIPTSMEPSNCKTCGTF